MRRRLVDPVWPDGRIPLEWIRQGAPQRWDRAVGQTVDCTAPGLAKLTYGVDGTAYFRDPEAGEQDSDPDYYFAELPHDDGNFMHVRLWKVRRSQLPSKHDLSSGSTSPLELTDTEGLAEAVDLVLFADECVVGLLVNRSGPSRAMVLTYLEEKTGVPLKLVPLTRDDALDLVNGDRVTAVDVEVAAGHFEAMASITEEIGEAASSVDTPGLRTLRLSLGAEPAERGQFWNWWMPRARSILGLPREEVRRLDVVQAGSEQLSAQVVNLLDEKIALQVSVPVAVGRTVEPDPARAAVIRGHDLHIEVIRKAADGLDAHGLNQRTERKRRVSHRGGTVNP